MKRWTLALLLALAACQPAEVDPAFDEAKGAELLAAYSDVHAASERICAATGVDPRSPNWWTLQIPRAVPAKVGAFFDGGVLCVRGQDVVASSIGAAANTRLVELMRQEGLEV